MSPARLGQHFLIDERVRCAIARAVAAGPGDRVLEIGPGRGFLTEALLSGGAQVTAVELDERLAEALNERWGQDPRLRLIRADFLKLDFSRLGPGPWKVAANLPYSVAAPILQRLLRWPAWTEAALMFQREVAERLTAVPGGPDFGLLTLSCALYAEVEPVLEVPREAFSPRPKVASAVVRLRRRPEPLLPEAEQEAFFKVARAAFGQRRKMAVNPLSRTLGLPREKVSAALSRCGVGASARAEKIPLEAWLRLPGELSS